MAITSSNFRKVEDITYHGGRLQSEVGNETALENVNFDGSIHVPAAVTKEQMVKFYTALSVDKAKSVQERKIYSRTIDIINEREELKKEINSLQEKIEIYESGSSENTVEDNKDEV